MTQQWTTRKMTMIGRTGAALAMLLIVGGCATVYDTKHDYQDGWRVVEVLKIGPGATLGFASVDCREPSNRSDGDGLFAYVQFDFRQIGRKYPHAGSSRRFAIVPVRDSLHIAPGDYVYVNIRDCQQPLERVSP